MKHFKGTFTMFAVFVMAFIVGMVFALTANAYEVPKDAVIKVYSKDGKLLGSMTRGTHKVVKLGTSVVKTVIVKETEQPKRRTSILLGGGIGKDGLKVKTDGSNYTIQEKDAAVGTVGVCSLKDGSGVCGTASTNETFGIQFIIPLGN